MTAQEILEIIEANMSVSNYAHEDYDYPEDLGFLSQEEKESHNKHEELAVKMRDFYNKNGWKETEETLQLREEQKQYLDWQGVETAFKKSLGVGDWVEVEQYGGEGKGESWYSVKHFIDHDIYIRTDGFYTSYNGTDFYDGYGRQVFPKQKTITVYE